MPGPGPGAFRGKHGPGVSVPSSGTPTSSSTSSSSSSSSSSTTSVQQGSTPTSPIALGQLTTLKNDLKISTLASRLRSFVDRALGD